MTSKTTLDITPSPRLLQVLGDIPLQPWQCLAELVDNSLDELLKQPDRSEEDPLTVDIRVDDEGPGRTVLEVTDNGFGMSFEELERSLKAGHSAKNRYGSLGLFGMGFNIATARLGNVTTVTTTQRGSGERLRAMIDFADIQRRESFSIPVERLDGPKDEEGTTVRVVLKKEMADVFRRKKTQTTLMGQLGDVYSFLLRDEVPGIAKKGYSSRIPARLAFNGDPIMPKLPCVWSEERSVTSYGQQVHAIQYVERVLTAATACLDCGYWDRKNGPEICEECGSTHLELRERRIWGWLGIQRYIDSQAFGVDFIRYGRKILKDDKSVFTYTDPDTLTTEAEYPIEMPANQGRIVGEIHLDHVPVTYQKNDFDRQSFDWQKAIEVIRGTGPLKPKGAREANDSPLALLYSAFRRNDPGLRYLTPGDGTKALNVKAREWASLFDKGVARMRDDTEWYEAALRHQEIKDAPEGGSVQDDPASDDVGDVLLGTTESATAPETKQPEKKQTRYEQLEEARHLGKAREDLGGSFKLSSSLGTWELAVVATRIALKDDAGRTVPAVPGVHQGRSIEVFVSTEHTIFREFGRDVRDVALIQAAAMIKDLSGSDLSPASVYSELVQEIPDLRATPQSILERTDKTLDRIRGLLLPVVANDPPTYWELLDSTDKQAIEEGAALAYRNDPFTEVVDDGRFVMLAGPATLAKLIESRSIDFFDGVVFNPSLTHRTDAARERIVGTVTRALLSLAAFKQDDLMRQKHDLQLIQINLDILDDQLSTEDRLL